MTTIGLDTSVIVRLLVGLPETQARRAKQRVDRALDDGAGIVVTDLAVAETYHPLHHHYGVPRAEARNLLRRFLASGVVRLAPHESMEAIAAAGGAGLVDRLIHARHRALGAITVTLERRQSRLEGAEQLAARGR